MDGLLVYGGALLAAVSSAHAAPYSIDFETDDDGNPMTPGVTDLSTFDPYDDLFSVGFAPMIYVTALPRTSSKVARTSERFRSCSVMRTFPQR